MESQDIARYEVRPMRFGGKARYWVVPVSPAGTIAGKARSAVDDEARAKELAERFNLELGLTGQTK